jgi:hypothetical protein|tara:strand:- start:742 stop:1125 length:384 start_codon:yes stop_codon:yes gene_type:complete
MQDDRNPKELIEELMTLFSSFKTRIEDPNFVQIEVTLKQLVSNQDDMKLEIRELKRQLLNPYDGVIIESKKNTEFRHEHEEFLDKFYELRDEHNNLLSWKANFVKIALTIITAAGGTIVLLLNKIFE